MSLQPHNDSMLTNPSEVYLDGQVECTTPAPETLTSVSDSSVIRSRKMKRGRGDSRERALPLKLAILPDAGQRFSVLKGWVDKPESTSDEAKNPRRTKKQRQCSPYYPPRHILPKNTPEVIAQLQNEPSNKHDTQQNEQATMLTTGSFAPNAPSFTRSNEDSYGQLDYAIGGNTSLISNNYWSQINSYMPPQGPTQLEAAPRSLVAQSTPPFGPPHIPYTGNQMHDIPTIDTTAFVSIQNLAVDAVPRNDMEHESVSAHETAVTVHQNFMDLYPPFFTGAFCDSRFDYEMNELSAQADYPPQLDFNLFRNSE